LPPEELDDLMSRFRISKCVIDALPEIHATRAFAERHRGQVWLNYFNENQKGSYKWDQEQHIVQVNRTEALDAAHVASDGFVDVRGNRYSVPDGHAGRLVTIRIDFEDQPPYSD
jgi:hypothetical protein